MGILLEIHWIVVAKAVLLSIPVLVWIIRQFVFASPEETIENVIERSTKPPVLYLRDFSADDEGPNIDIAYVPTNKLFTYEEILSVNVKRIGPLIAIGRPDDDKEYTGAVRSFYNNDSWQKEVIRLMGVSNMIVFCPSFSEGLLWELRQIVDLGFLNKTVIWVQFPGLPESVLQHLYYKKFRRMISNLMPELPELPDLVGNKILIYFENDKSFATNNWNVIPFVQSIIKGINEIKQIDGSIASSHELKRLENNKEVEEIGVLSWVLIIIVVAIILYYIA